MSDLKPKRSKPQRCTECDMAGHNVLRCPRLGRYETERRPKRTPGARGPAIARNVNATRAEWDAFDRAAERVQMNRSQFLRHAASQLIARLWPAEG